MGRALGLLCVFVSSFALTLAVLPDWAMLSQVTGALVALLAFCCTLRRVERMRLGTRALGAKWLRGCERLLVLLIAGLVMLMWVVWRTDLRLQDRLDPALENVVTRVAFRIESMVRDQSDSFRFDAQVLDPVPLGVPRHLEIVWRSTPQPQERELMPGQVWRAALILRTPRGFANPHGFDYEGHAFARNVRALGRVRGVPIWQRDDSWASLVVVVGRVRQALRTCMRRHLENKRYGAVLIALAIGDQDSVDQRHWRVFNLTGITHLVSISGSHVTMIAAMGGLVMFWLSRRVRWQRRALCEWIPARVLAAMASVVVAFCYCLLAGWGVPARRTFFMLLVVGAALSLRLPVSMSGVLCFAAGVLVVIDPWAPLATGFWLSFGAVAVLFSAAHGVLASSRSESLPQRLWSALSQATRLQWLITVAMTPPLAFLFQQVSLSSPLANALAIPVVTFVVTPLALLLALISVFPGIDSLAAWLAWCGHAALQAVLLPITWLSQAPWGAFSVSAMPLTWLFVALVGAAWALLPRGTPVRWTGWVFMLPALAWQPQRPAAGDWSLLALDVGQGTAILISTAQHHLLFDAGPAMGQTDAGQRIVIPVLRALGVRALDALVLSHADIDHTGGLESLYAELTIPLTYASFDVGLFLQERLRRRRIRSRTLAMDEASSKRNTSLNLQRCIAGMTWHWDGVTFTFLHPQEASHVLTPGKQGVKAVSKIRTNAQSCVLKISGQHHTALLPGDLPAQQERALVGLQRNALAADVVVIPHHGSATSSSTEFVDAVGARHALALVGYQNRFQHPDPLVERRWRQVGSTLWRSDRHGAIEVQSVHSALIVRSQRALNHRYWHRQE